MTDCHVHSASATIAIVRIFQLRTLILHRMAQMLLVVLLVLGGYLSRPDHQQVLGVRFLGGLREVETAGDDYRTVDYHHLVVGDQEPLSIRYQYKG
jgi:hypothetical protein